MNSRPLLVIWVVSFVLIGMSCVDNEAELRLPPKWVITPTVPVFLNPKSQHVKPGGEFSLDIEVMPEGWEVSAGEVTLTFDPKALEVVNIRPGDLLGAKTLLGTEKVDGTGGSIIYALARVGKTTAPGVRGVFATVKFKARASAKGTLTVNITKVGLANEKFEDVKGLKVQGATIIMD